MNYNDTLSWLRNLLGSQQGINSTQFGQNLGLQQQQVTNQNDQFMAELANRLALQQGQTQGQIAVQAPQLQTQRDLQAQQLAAELGMQKNQLGEVGRQFDVSSGLTKQQQLWNQMMGLNQFNFNKSQAEDAAMASRAAAARKSLGLDSEAAPLVYAGQAGYGTVRPNNASDLMKYWRWQTS